MSLGKGDISLNAASCGYPLRKYTGRDTWMGKKYLVVENIQVIAEEELFNRLYILSNMCLL